MASSNFKYTRKDHATEDLKRFSTFNMFEGTTLYMCKSDNVWTIETRVQRDHQVEGVALNGQLFLPA